MLVKKHADTKRDQILTLISKIFSSIFYLANESSKKEFTERLDEIGAVQNFTNESNI